MPHPQPPGFLAVPATGKGRGLNFAQADDYESVSDVGSMEDSIRAAGRPVDFHIYPGTVHWFFEPDRFDAYHEGAARLAWERTLAFLENELT